MLNLDKINTSIDLSEIDFSRLVIGLAEYKKFIKIFFIVVSLLIAGMIFNEFHHKEQAIKTSVAQAQEKLEVIKSRNTAIQDLGRFKSTLPKEMDQFQLITEISNDANLYHVTITSLYPPEVKNFALYSVLNFQFTAVSDNFRKMMLFLRSIEKSVPPLRIDSWQGNEGEDGKVSADIQISAVHINT